MGQRDRAALRRRRERIRPDRRSLGDGARRIALTGIERQCGCGQVADDLGIDGDIAPCVERQRRRRRPADDRIDENVAVAAAVDGAETRIARAVGIVGEQRDVGGRQRARDLTGGRRVDGEIIGVDQPVPGLARHRTRIDPAREVEIAPGRGLDKATAAARRAAARQRRAPKIERALSENDHVAAAARRSLRRCVDRRAAFDRDVFRRRQPHAPAAHLGPGRADEAAVAGKRIDVAARRAQFRRSRRDAARIGDVTARALDEDTPVAARRLQHHAGAGGETGGAARRQRAAVRRDVPDQHRVAARLYAARVGDARQRGADERRRAARHEAAGVERTGGPNETSASDDLSGCVDDDAGRIDQVKRPGGAQLPGNRRRITAEHTVEGGPAAVVELDGPARADREALPVDDRPGRALVDRQLIAGWKADAGRPRNHLPAGRQLHRLGVRRAGNGEREHGARPFQATADRQPVHEGSFHPSRYWGESRAARAAA